MGRLPADLIGMPVLALSDEHLPSVGCALRLALAGDTTTATIESLAGRILDTWFAPLRSPDGLVTGAIVVATDITERCQAERELERREAKFRGLVQHSSDMTVVVDRSGVVLYASPEAERRLGFHAGDDLRGASGWLVDADDREASLRTFNAVLAAPGAVQRMEGRIRLADGTWCHVEAFLTNLCDEPAVAGIVCNMRDISERKAAEQQLLWQAFHDPLTGLPNRALFLDRLSGALARSERRSSAVAVLFLDIDRFKVINDSLGHDAGDGLLCSLTSRIVGALRPEDTVARLGGDEFTVLCEDVDLERDPMGIAERLSIALSAPFAVEDREVFLSTSIGIAVATGALGFPEGMLRDADAAMYRAKERGRNRFELFDEAMRDRAVERLETEHALHRAVELGQLRLYYQPIIDLSTGSVAGVEALVRWQHPDLGLLLPDHFIPLAEETGLIVVIGEWVLREACRQMRRWEQTVGLSPAFTINVNLSAGQLTRPRLPKTVQAALEHARVDPARLTLEITESTLMEEPEAAIATLRDLKSLGVSLCVDDFGTGYSSLSYLKRLPIDALKVDQSFVAGLDFDVEDRAITEAVVALAHTLGLGAVAEGVEDDRQLAQLRRLGCDGAQGFLFSEALPAVGATELLRRRPTW
jgi:diguanylate cyclase (GGDEF)-like protein/PAS domain S-box-containing protein